MLDRKRICELAYQLRTDGLPIKAGIADVLDHYIELTTLNEDAFIKTASGRKVYLFKCAPDDILMSDVIHSLAGQVRFYGHVPAYWTVAHHIIHGADLIAYGKVDIGYHQRSEVMRHWLMHDGPEAYTGDMTAPLKNAGSNYAFEMFDAHITKQFERRFDLNFAKYKDVIKQIDNIVLEYEQAWRFSSNPEPISTMEQARDQLEIIMKMWFSPAVTPFNPLDYEQSK